MLPVIGVVARCEKKELFDQIEIHQEYLEAIIKFGGDPLLLYQNTIFDRKDKSRLARWLKKCDGIVITGGTDESDFDYYILDYAIKHNLPVFGICLGMQIMATYQTENPLVKISTFDHLKPYEQYVHKVHLTSSSKISHYLKHQTTINVNSRHVEMITTGGIFTITGKSEDGIIECLENPAHDFQIGVQWHPESMISYDENSRRLWYQFIKVCKKNHRK